MERLLWKWQEFIWKIVLLLEVSLMRYIASYQVWIRSRLESEFCFLFRISYTSIWLIFEVSLVALVVYIIIL